MGLFDNINARIVIMESRRGREIQKDKQTDTDRVVVVVDDDTSGIIIFFTGHYFPIQLDCLCQSCRISVPA